MIQGDGFQLIDHRKALVIPVGIGEIIDGGDIQQRRHLPSFIVAQTHQGITQAISSG